MNDVISLTIFFGDIGSDHLSQFMNIFRIANMDLMSFSIGIGILHIS